MNKKDRTDCYKKSGYLSRRICAYLLAVLALVVLSTGCSFEGGGQETEADVGAMQNAPPEYQMIDTAYGPLRIAADSLERLRHTEIIENGVTKEVFHMLPEDGGRELFQICFGNTDQGIPIGQMRVGDGTVTVSVISPEYDMNTFNEEEKATYGMLLDQLNVLLSSIRDSENFGPYEARKEEDDTAYQAVALTYWTVMLPETMQVEESNRGDIYTADFYGMVGSERIHLYQISLGDASAESILGMYTTDDLIRTLGVTPYSLSSQAAWISDDQNRAYAVLMDTINEVLPIITGSENFTAEMPE